MEFISAYKHIGHSVERLHAPRSRRGQDLVDDLLRFVSDREIPLALGQPAERLIVEDGAVKGAVVAGEDIRARNVLLATNGFAADRALVARHCAEIAPATYYGAPGSSGEAVRWGEALDAAFGNMGAYQGYAAVAVPQGQLLSWTTIEKGGILVGRDGRRFGDESRGYSGFAPAVMAQGDLAWAVFDAAIHEIALAEEEYAEMAAMGAVTWADTPEGLAEAAGLGPGGLAETVEAYNRAATGQAEDVFGRRDFGRAPLAPPFAAVKVQPGLFHTQGGLLVDGDARVRRRGGGVVPGLFAGGGAAAGISGRTGAAGYASGNGLVTALVLGRRAGLAAAAGAQA
jgi:fumarate reductase flavoprotein subunit